jgi:class 3 adenylate cyclase
MSSLAEEIEEIIEYAKGDSFPTSSLLRYALVVTKKVNDRQFEEFVTNELKGYRNRPLPKHRYVRGKVILMSPVGHPFENVDVDGLDPERLRKVSTAHLGETVSIIENTMRSQGDDGFFTVGFTEDNEGVLPAVTSPNVEYGIVLFTMQLRELLDDVRGIILDWAIEKQRGLVSREASGHLKSEVKNSNSEGNCRMEPEKKRDELIEEYFALGDRLRKQDYHRAFLSIDLAGSTKMKRDEDTLNIESSFRRYHLLLEETLKRHNAIQFTWAGDGSMSLFAASQDAVNAAIDLLQALDTFNQQQNRLRKPFQARCGIHTGNIYADESTPLEQITSINIDIAGHLQKTSEPNGLLVSGATLSELANAAAFSPLSESVDGQRVWRLRTVTRAPEPSQIPQAVNRSPKEEQRVIARKILAALYEAWAKHTIISLNPVCEEGGWKKEFFRTVVDVLEDRGLVKAYGSSYSYEITPEGVLYAEDNSVVSEEVANWHRRIRTHILTFLTDLYEREGSRAHAHYEKIAESGSIDRLKMLVDLSLLSKIGYVEATSVNTFRITFEGLRSTSGDESDDIV